ncbi:MAG: type II toxin-antitoxin system VapC family toxin [Rhizobiaceae bacterium]
MILVDTNVISEPLQAFPNERVISWIDSQPVETLYLSAISVAELRFGMMVLPEGKRKARLRLRFEEEILPVFQERIIAFDLGASHSYANLMARARARAQGKAISKADGYIAAIAMHHGLMVASRDVAPFEAAELAVINPWDL